jgi:hypothetical protein
MKNLIHTSIILFILFCSISAFSQITRNQDLLNDKSTIGAFDLRSKNLVGSSYIDDAFLPVRLSTDETIYSMRYDAYQDEMEVEKDGNTYYLKKDYNYTATFINSDKIYKVYNYEEKDILKTGFFVVLYSGNIVSLLSKEKIKFYEEVEAKTGYEKYQPPKLKRESDQLFIGYKNNTAKEFPNKKKDIIKMFSGKSNEIESYAKKNKLGFKKQEDLIKIFKYYNSL